MAEPLLLAEHLTLASSSGPIVSDLSFSLSPGEIVALTGKSGSGKTSVAMALLAMLPEGITMTSGMIRWLPSGLRLKDPEHFMQWKQLRGTHIGYTQQDAYGAFDPVLEMGTQMCMIIAERSPDIRTITDKALQTKMEEVGLRDIPRLWTSYPHQLSGGQLQRCQIAMALVMQPRLLICDEPTSAVDRIHLIELMDLYARIRTDYGMSILLITHETHLVRHLADREITLGKANSSSGMDSLLKDRQPEKSFHPIVTVKGLAYNHAYGGLIQKSGTSIGPFDFALRQGACLGIVGASGSGKSTLAQMLVGLLVPSAGEIILQGKRIEPEHEPDLRLLRSRIQMVMQDGRGSLHPYLTIREQFEQVLLHNGDLSEAEMVQSLSKVALPGQYLDRRPDQLSGGECLRVSIARSLLLHPQVLVCDESTSALDPETRDEILELLRSLQQNEGMSLVFIAHDDQVIRDLADYVLVIEEGKVIESGPLELLLTAPQHPLTRQLLSFEAPRFGKSKT